MATETAVPAIPALADPDLESQISPAPSGPEGDWLCAWCLNLVANERDRFTYAGKNEFTFTNPAGLRFEIITFCETRACHQQGVPTLEHTWFPGHAWSYCQCGQCGQHLGWNFTGQHHFAGLIKERIVRAFYLRN
jgi:hypothetical protein